MNFNKKLIFTFLMLSSVLMGLNGFVNPNSGHASIEGNTIKMELERQSHLIRSKYSKKDKSLKLFNKSVSDYYSTDIIILYDIQRNIHEELSSNTNFPDEATVKSKNRISELELYSDSIQYVILTRARKSIN